MGPCLNHCRIFRGILPSTGTERLSDTVKFQHHVIGIPEIMPSDRILEVARQLDAAIRELPKKDPMDTLEAIQTLREVMLGKKSATPQSQRVEEAAPRKAAPTTRTWHGLDRNAKAFLNTKIGGPLWSKVSRRITLSLSTGDVIEDLQVNNSMSEKLLHCQLPAGTSGTCTILFHGTDSVANMSVPTIQPQKVATKLDTDADDEAQEPN